MSRQPASVWRLAVLWQDAVLDVVTVKKRRTAVTLRTGEVIHVRVVASDAGARVEVRGGFGVGSVRDGELLALPAGHALLAHEDVPAPAMGGFRALDSTLFHATMIGAAFQAVFVSALVLTPAGALDPEAGGGFPGELRRLIVMPGGTAPTVGAAAVSAVGRKPDEAEQKHEVVRSRGAPPRVRGMKGQTLEQALDEMKRALHLGDGGAELKETLGELAQATARAPELGAGVGGLAPRDPLSEGVGNGLVGAGESRIAEILKRRVEEQNARPDLRLPPRDKRSIGPVQLQDVPHADVTLDPRYDLDPVVKDELARAVRQRHNTIRYCYESWGLSADPSKAGRLTLELTLLPDGRVKDPRAVTDDASLHVVGACVERMVADWHLGDGLVEEPTRLAFPFVLQPRRDARGVVTFDAP